MDKRKLFFFTTTYPFGSGEFFIENEMDFLKNTFEEIVLVSNNINDSQTRRLPENILVRRLDYHLTKANKLLSYLNVFKRVFWEEIQVLRKTYKQPFNFLILNSILQSIQKAILVEKYFKKYLEDADEQGIYLYSYWANDAAIAIAWLKYKGYPVKGFCRAHRWDVYFEKNESNYLPLRKFMASNLDAVYFISQDGKKYFEQKMGASFPSLKISKLGVFPVMENKSLCSNRFHLFSCSSVIPRKRVDLIAEALATLPKQFSCKWTHFGDGLDMSLLKSKCSILLDSKPNIDYRLAGGVSNEEVRAFYANEGVDLFINVSISEGIPVSIMEAMSAGVPALATDVDGNGEIVKNDYNGYLVPYNISAENLGKIIVNHHQLPFDKVKIIRDQAKKTWQDDFNARKNYTDFIEDVLSL